MDLGTLGGLTDKSHPLIDRAASRLCQQFVDFTESIRCDCSTLCVVGQIRLTPNSFLIIGVKVCQQNKKKKGKLVLNLLKLGMVRFRNLKYNLIVSSKNLIETTLDKF